MADKTTVRRHLNGIMYPVSVRDIAYTFSIPEPSVRRILGELREEGVKVKETLSPSGRRNLYAIEAGV